MVLTPSAPTPVSVNMPTEKGDFIDKIKPDAIVETILHRLMGEKKENGVWVSIPALKDKSLTERGAWDIANLLLPASSQNVSISKTQDEDIRNRVKSMQRTAIRMCLRNWKEYGIHGSDQISFVREVVATHVFFTMKQSDGGGIQGLFKETTNTTGYIGGGPAPNEEKKGGFLRGLFRR